MKTFTIALLAGAAALSAGVAKASDIYVSEGYASPPVQQVRMVCDEYGNCYQSRGGARVVVRDSYNYYEPRDRYNPPRVYRERGWDEPRAGVGIRAPGVSVGIGVGGDRW